MLQATSNFLKAKRFHSTDDSVFVAIPEVVEFVDYVPGEVRLLERQRERERGRRQERVREREKNLKYFVVIHLKRKLYTSTIQSILKVHSRSKLCLQR